MRGRVSIAITGLLVAVAAPARAEQPARDRVVAVAEEIEVAVVRRKLVTRYRLLGDEYTVRAPPDAKLHRSRDMASLLRRELHVGLEKGAGMRRVFRLVHRLGERLDSLAGDDKVHPEPTQAVEGLPRVAKDGLPRRRLPEEMVLGEEQRGDLNVAGHAILLPFLPPVFKADSDPSC